MRPSALLLAGLLATTVLAAARAQPQRDEARVGLQTETSSIDPHFALVGANQTVAQHIFDPMLAADSNLRPLPGLTSFSNPAPDLWEFTIREGARFQDGTPVTTQDILFSLQRMPKVPNSPAPFIRMAGAVLEMQVVDNRTIRLRSRGPDPSVILNAMTAYVVPEHVAKDATTVDFNSGKAAIGSGPWRFREWQPGSSIALQRNDDYWGEKPAFARATLRPVANDAARLAALLAGDLDLIDGVPPGEIARLRGNKAVGISSATSSRVIYLALDQSGDSTPFVMDKDGKPLLPNPLRDARVRRALSLGIDRQAIVDRVLSGASRPAGQLAVEGQVGYAPDLATPVFDPNLAKRLLAEAGYPDGFRITLHSPNNRYIEDDKTSQAVAQFWTRLGIETRVEVMPSNVFFTRAGKREFSAFLIGFGHTTGDAWLGLSQVLHSYDAAKALGGLNRGRYSSARFDALLDDTRTVTEMNRRAEMLQAAQEIAFREEAGIIPLHVPNNTWAHRAGLFYEAGLDENTLTQHLRITP
jgi:peptide/nickel transport system substrate-binding protein